MVRPSTGQSNPEPGGEKGKGPAFDRLVRAVALWGGGFALFALIGLIVADVVLRYFWNAPIYGARDLGKLLLLTMIALCTAYSAQSGGQVAIETFSGFLGPTGQRRLDLGTRLVASAMLAVLSWRLAANGLSAGRYGETSLTLTISYAPFYFLLAAGMALYGLVLVVEIFRLLKGEELEPGAHQGDHR